MTVTSMQDLDISTRFVFLGTEYGGWPICTDLMIGKQIIYSVGIGTDISWDLEMIRGYDCEIHAYDPTPISEAWLSKQQLPQQFNFYPIGLSANDGFISFAPPAVDGHVSYSAQASDTAGNKLEKFKVKMLASLKKENRHEKIDILKIDIEGMEYDVIENIFDTGIFPTQFLIEFHHGMYDCTDSDTHHCIKKLYSHGYRRFYKSKSGREQAFVLQHKLQSAECGVVYFAFGKLALSEAELSAKSLKISNPNIRSAIFTDMRNHNGIFDIVYDFNRQELQDINYYFLQTNRMPSLKVRFLEKSPFYKTIHLDADTYVKGSLSPFYDELNTNDIVLTNMPELEQQINTGEDRPNHQSIKQLTRGGSFSCAVFGYRKTEQTLELLKAWWTMFVEKTAGEMRMKGNWGTLGGGINEQHLLHMMLADGTFVRTGINKTIIPNTIYNAGMSMWPKLKQEGLWDQVAILHSHKILESINMKTTNIDGLPDLPELQKFL